MTENQKLQMDVYVNIGGMAEREPGTFTLYEYSIVDKPHIILEATMLDEATGQIKLDVTVDGPVEPATLKTWFGTTIKAIAEQLP